VKKEIEDWLYSALSTKWCGSDHVPLNHETFKRGERVAMFTNDAFDIGVGTSDEWIYIFRREEFQAMALWYLRCWAVKEWFGLRRKLWYWLLHRRVSRACK
jgi:hypothetical protein